MVLEDIEQIEKEVEKEVEIMKLSNKKTKEYFKRKYGFFWFYKVESLVHQKVFLGFLRMVEKENKNERRFEI